MVTCSKDCEYANKLKYMYLTSMKLKLIFGIILALFIYNGEETFFISVCSQHRPIFPSNPV
jgi:hypothetical protein